MENDSSQIILNGGDLHAESDLRLTKGIVTTEGKSFVSTSPLATIYIGDGIDPLNNLGFYYKFNMVVRENSNVVYDNV